MPSTNWDAKQKKDLTAKTINTILMTAYKDRMPDEKEGEEIVFTAFKMIEKLEELCGDGLMNTNTSPEVSLDCSDEIDI